MAIDPYTLCPGGTGKKMKFCCSDLLGEWEKIQRMLDGDQWLACLEHIEKLETKHPDRACLLGVKAALQRDLDRLEEAEATAKLFLEKHPDNPVALAEAAMIKASLGEGLAALGPLGRALEVSESGILARVHEAVTVVAAALLEEGAYLAAQGCLILAVNLDPEDKGASQLWTQFFQSPDVPLLFKDSHHFSDCSPDAAWRVPFREAVVLAYRGAWRLAAEKLAALLEQAGDAPAIWRNLAVLRGWMGDTPGAVEALRKFAAMDVSLDDAVEAEALAQVIDSRESHEWIDGLAVTYAVSDVDGLLARIESHGRFLRMPVNPALMAEGEPLPKAQFFLLDRPMPAPAADLAIEVVPVPCGQIQVFGRQTDRPARLVLVTSRDADLAQSESLLSEVAGDAVTLPGEEKVLGPIATVEKALTGRIVPPAQTTVDQYYALSEQARRDAILNRWPLVPLDALDGKNAREAAGDPAYRVKLLAAILLVEAALQQQGSSFDFNELRGQLGLPAAEPIDGSDPHLNRLPLVRWSRLGVATLSNEQLASFYQRALAFLAVGALRKLAREVAERPSLEDPERKLSAASILVRIEPDPRERLKYLFQARDLAVAQGRSSAPFDLAELTLRIERGEMQPAVDVINHLQSSHAKEPGVMQRLAETLVHFGLLAPDGTPPGPPPQEEPSIIVPGGSPEQAGKLWTPGGETSTGEKPALWTPGMD
jgi:tetratricopeptide (TPR) repeat protein